MSPLSSVLRRAPLLLAASIGCSDSTSPAGPVLPGTYVLRRIAGDALPAELYTTRAGVSVRVIADTLRFMNDGTGTHVQVASFDFAEAARGEGAFSWNVDDGRLEITHTCMASAMIVSAHLSAVPEATASLASRRCTMAPGPHLVARRLDASRMAARDPYQVAREPQLYELVPIR